MNVRLIIPEDIRFQTRTVNGRTYSGTGGAILTVPDFDAGPLSANGWIWLVISGPTTARPAGSLGLYPAVPGATFFDETLGYQIVFDGLVWRNPVTDAVV